MDAIKVSNLTKKFKNVLAVNNISFNVKEEVLVQLKNIIGEYMKKRINKKFNSLEFLENSYWN